MYPRGRVHNLPAVEPGQQGGHGTAEEGVGFEPCGGSGGSDGGDGDDGDDGDDGKSLGVDSASEAAGGRRGGN